MEELGGEARSDVWRPEEELGGSAGENRGSRADPADIMAVMAWPLPQVQRSLKIYQKWGEDRLEVWMIKAIVPNILRFSTIVQKVPPKCPQQMTPKRSRIYV